MIIMSKSRMHQPKSVDTGVDSSCVKKQRGTLKIRTLKTMLSSVHQAVPVLLVLSSDNQASLPLCITLVPEVEVSDISKEAFLGGISNILPVT